MKIHQFFQLVAALTSGQKLLVAIVVGLFVGSYSNLIFPSTTLFSPMKKWGRVLRHLSNLTNFSLGLALVIFLDQTKVSANEEARWAAFLVALAIGWLLVAPVLRSLKSACGCKIQRFKRGFMFPWKFFPST
jgi:hypothetical protein